MTTSLQLPEGGIAGGPRHEPVTPKVSRNLALDFTKGILVLLMVLYHWLNYFVTSDEVVYRYLRFVTGSFIFIAGFLIGSVYVTKYGRANFGLYQRLLQRGAKLIGLFTVLNLLIAALNGPHTHEQLWGFAPFLNQAHQIYITGGARGIAFDVLVPISYVLLIAPLMIAVHHRLLPVICVVVLATVFAGSVKGFSWPNLELWSFGLLGLAMGQLPLATIDSIRRFPWFVITLYVLYLVGITVWNVVYWLQIAGVLLNMSLLYLAGLIWSERVKYFTKVQLLGTYSLFAYIAQIGVLRFLRTVIAHVHIAPNVAIAVSCLCSFALTVLAVILMDRTRSLSPGVDKAYRAVFA